MRHPFAGGNTVDWSQCVHHHIFFHREQTVADVYGKMLVAGIDFAGAFDEKEALSGLISFRMLSSALSARYGQALFADKALGRTSVPKVIFGPVADQTADEAIPLVIPLAKAVLLQPKIDFFEAQKLLERRSAERSYDDLIVTSDGGKYVGVISMIEFMNFR